MLESCDNDDQSCKASAKTETTREEQIIQASQNVDAEAIAYLKYLQMSQGNYESEETDGRKGDRDGKFYSFKKFFSIATIANALSFLSLFGGSVPAVANIPATTMHKTIPKQVEYVVQTIVPPAAVNKCNMIDYEPCRNGEGVCSSASACERDGGESIGRCGNCMGCSVCCKYTTGCQGITDKMITYFQNPGYPRSDIRNEACSLTVNIRDDVCQVKIDFIDFEMAAPIEGSCSTVDNLQIMNTAQPGGVLGPSTNRLCGVNTDQHMYLPVKPNNMLMLKATTTGLQNVPLANTAGPPRFSGDTAFRWNLRVTQIPCEGRPAQGLSAAVGAANCTIPSFYKKAKAPDGCRQYFTEMRGQLRTFSFDSKSEVMKGLDYAVCIGRDDKVCGMTLNALTFSLPASPGCLTGDNIVDPFGGFVNLPAMTSAGPPAGLPTLCCAGAWDPAAPVLPATLANTPAMLPGINYFGFAGLGNGQSAPGQRMRLNTPNQNRFFYCGQQLGSGNLVIGRTKGPLILRVVTSGTYWATTPAVPPTPQANFCPAGGCLGFMINYDVDSGTC